MIAQPVGEIAKQEHLAQRQAKLEQAMLVQRHRAAAGRTPAQPERFDAHVVADDRRDPAGGDPVEQACVLAVEAGPLDRIDRAAFAPVMPQKRTVHPRAKAQDVAWFDDNIIAFEDRHHCGMIDPRQPLAKILRHIDHYAAPLDTRLGHGLDPERSRAERPLARGSAIEIINRAMHMRAPGKTIVVGHHRPALPRRIEDRSDMRQRIPLRRKLQRHIDPIVAQNVSLAFGMDAIRQVHHRIVTAIGRRQNWRRAQGRKTTARAIERQRQAEHFAFANFGETAQPPLGCNQVEPPHLIVGAEIAPVRSFRANTPTVLFFRPGHLTHQIISACPL